MDLDPDSLAAVLAGARRCHDSSRDAYFQHVAQRLKFFKGESLAQTIADALAQFGERQTKTNSSKRPKRRKT